MEQVVKHITRKGRRREYRGILENFNDLPTYAQDIFKKVREIIIERYGINEVYVFGSFYWGFWDDKSDYDVLVQDHINSNEMFLMFKNEYGMYVNVSNQRFYEKKILIPLDKTI
jgi:hypothetical protein